MATKTSPPASASLALVQLEKLQPLPKNVRKLATRGVTAVEILT